MNEKPGLLWIGTILSLSTNLGFVWNPTTVRVEYGGLVVDRVIFCVFLKSDEDLYMSRLPAYFPKDGSLKSKL